VGGVAGGLLAGGLLVVGVGAAVGLWAGAGDEAGDELEEPEDPLLLFCVTVVEELESDGASGIATCWKRPLECLVT